MLSSLLEVAFWAFMGAATLVVGSLVALRFDVGWRNIGLIMGFGAGTLIAAVAFDLTVVAYDEAGDVPTFIGLAAGALTFWAGDWLLERRTGGEDPVVGAKVSGPSLVLGALLDGVPESVAIGTTLLGGSSVSVAMVVAVAISNVPEGLAATAGLKHAGMPANRILSIWAGVVAISVAAAVVGYLVLGDAPADTIAITQAFAGGAILAMLANTMMPEAYANGGREVGLVTVLGFIISSFLAGFN